MTTILIIGGGGREHTLSWKLSQSDEITKVYVSPGNGGTEGPKIEQVHTKEIKEMVNLAKQLKVSFVVVGPEAPLSEGLADELLKEGILCFGPTKAAALIESEKAFAKDFMIRHNIPTAKYKSFTNYEEACEYIEKSDFNVVVKASGLAAGKGVIIPKDKVEAKEAVKEMLVNKVFGNAGATVVIEELLIGEEASFLAFCDGTNFSMMPVAQDHKRIFDGDMGPNTGGMGAFAPSPTVSASIIDEVANNIIAPAVKGMKDEGYPFVGVLYAGVMMTKDGIKTLEYNCRFGDPETQVIIPLLKSDLATILLACIKGNLGNTKVLFETEKTSVTVVAASEGYPGDYKKGRIIYGLDEARDPDVFIFHAGTEKKDGNIVTSGGRVLTVTALGKDIKEAISKSYAAINRIHFEGMQYRKDIGAKKLNTVKIGVLGSTRGTDLQAIIDSINNRTINAKIVSVISNIEKAYILERAANHSLPHHYVPSKGRVRKDFENDVIKLLDEAGAELILLIGFMRILSPKFCDHYKNRLLNVHPSLLPEFAGGMDTDVHEAVIKAGKKKTGCTVHFVTAEVDKGGIVCQLECQVDDNETKESLKEKVQKLEGKALIECIRMFQQGRLKPKDVGSSYKDAGVDIDKGDSLVEAIKPFAALTARPGTDSSLGGFGCVFDMKAAGYKDPLLVSGTDGVGTKLEIAKMSNIHDTIGQDLVAMCVNDVLVQGAEPLFFLDYFATGTLNVQQAKDVIRGIANACKECGCGLTGGETAEMPGLYKKGDYDLAGFCVGAVERNQLIPRYPTEIVIGDILIGITSSGLHSNGFSLVRHIISQNNIDVYSPPPYPSSNKRLCDDLLIPTKLYVKPILPLMKSNLIKAAAHITGGGLPDNLPRVLGKDTDKGLSFHIDMNTWKVPEVFKWLIKLGKVNVKEALRTWNCGIGMVLVVSETNADKVLDVLKKTEVASIIGKVEATTNQEELVNIINTQQLQ